MNKNSQHDLMRIVTFVSILFFYQISFFVVVRNDNYKCRLFYVTFKTPKLIYIYTHTYF